MVNKLSVIGGVWLYTLRLSSIVYRPGAIVWVLAHAYFCIFVLIIKIFFLFSASFQTFCLTARAYLNTQKY